MKPIRVHERGVGECLITPDTKIKDSSKYLIKALCFLIMMCMNEKKDNKIEELIKILDEAVRKTEELFNEGSQNGKVNPTELF